MHTLAAAAAMSLTVLLPGTVAATQPQPTPDQLSPQPPAPLDRIGMPMTPPPITQWLVGEPVTEFKPGTIYVVSMYGDVLGAKLGPSLWPEEFRLYLGALQKKLGDKAVFIELVQGDEPHSTLRGGMAKTYTDDPEVQTRLAICPEETLATWCGEDYIARAISIVISSDGSCACITRHHSELPVVLDQLVAGKFDPADHARHVAAAHAIRIRKPPTKDSAEHLQRLDEELAVYRSPHRVVGRAKILLKLDRADEAAAEIESILQAFTLPDRQLLERVRFTSPIIRDGGDGALINSPRILELQLQAAKLLAATSDMQRYSDLTEVAKLAAQLKQYDTAIEYQTLAVARASDDRQQREAMVTLREYTDAAAK